MYINFIGIDGCGKDAVFEAIEPKLPYALTTMEPGGCPASNVIRKALLSPDIESLKELEQLATQFHLHPETERLISNALEILQQEPMNGQAEMYLFAASRSQSLHDAILPHLSNNLPVLGRRSVACSMAYQGYARGVGLVEVWKVNERAIRGIYPTLEIYLDIDPKESIRRIHGRPYADRFDNESLSFWERVVQGYHTYYNEYCPYDVAYIDANQTLNQVVEDVEKTLSPFLNPIKMKS